MSFSSPFVCYDFGYQHSRRVRMRRRLSNQSAQHRRSIMPPGFCMFDANKRLVLCNDSYADVPFATEFARTAGATHDAIIGHRVLSGLMGKEKTDSAVKTSLPFGSTVGYQNLTSDRHAHSHGSCDLRHTGTHGGGGWVATHEDVTERYKLEYSYNSIWLPRKVAGIPSMLQSRPSASASKPCLERS